MGKSSRRRARLSNPRARAAFPETAAHIAQAPPAPLASDVALLCGFVFSGVAALGLELIWVRVLGVAFGSESFGMLGVLAGFFAGLALGAALFHRAIIRSRRPALIYVAAETAIAVYALAGPIFMLPFADALPRWLGPVIGDNRSLRALALNLLVATVVLLPATVAMGATTVAGVEAWQRRRSRGANADTVAWLYAANTLGATAGVGICIYVLLPALGTLRASASVGAFSLAAALLVGHWQRQGRVPTTHAAETAQPPGAPSRGTRASRWLLYGLLFFTGLAGIGLETVGTHVLAQIFENTVHTFADILAVYLLGTAAGAAIYATRGAPRLANRAWGTSALLFGLGVAGIAAGIVLAHAGAVMAWLAPAGCSYPRRMAAEALTSALVFLPPTMLMGATFSHLVGHFAEEGIGYASAFNTLGASLAPFVFGLVLIPSAGYGVAFFGATALYGLLLLIAALVRRQRMAWIFAALGAAGVAGALAFSPLVLVGFPPGVDLLAQRFSLQGVVSVTEDRTAVPAGATAPRILRVDQNFLMGGWPAFVTQRMGQLPMLVASSPRDVLYLGVGTGITAGAALDFPVQRVTAVELLPEVLDLLPWFSPYNNDLQHDRRVTLHSSDARRFVQATPDTYDVIVADLYHPSRDGTGALYTTEHFGNIRGRLREGGLFVQWLPLYQLRPEDLRTIVRTFLGVFLDAQSMLGNYSGNARLALLGWAPRRDGDPPGAHVDLAHASALLAQARKARDSVIDGIPDLLASYMLDTEALRRYAGAGPVNTDVNQRITFDAAGGVDLTTDVDSHLSLASLLPYRVPFPDDFIRATDPREIALVRQDVAPYAEAVTHYLAGEILRLEARSEVVPAAAIADYMKAYRSDPRFAPAIGKVLEAALVDPPATKELVDRLWEINPRQADIDRLRRHLEGVDSPSDVRAIVARFLATGGD